MHRGTAKRVVFDIGNEEDKIEERSPPKNGDDEDEDQEGEEDSSDEEEAEELAVGQLVQKNYANKYMSEVYVLDLKVSSIVMSQRNGEIDNYIGKHVQAPLPLLELVLDELSYSMETN